MPRTTPFVAKQQWLAEFEAGETVAQLARKHKRDPRTIERGIETAQQHRMATETRTELMKEGLKQHQRDLLELLNVVVLQLQPLPIHVELHHPGVALPSPLKLGGVHVLASEGRYVAVCLDREDQFLWRLLEEHVGRSRAFVQLRRWKRAVLDEMNQRLALRDDVVNTVTGVLGLKVEPESRGDRSIRREGLYELYMATVSRALDKAPPQRLEAVHDEGSGEFYINGVTAGRALSDWEDLRRAFEEFPGQLTRGQVAAHLRHAHDEVDEQARSAREAFLGIRLSHYLPGTCRACGLRGR